jgi:hypothetical protein
LRPETAVLVGTTPIALSVPAHYQASIFPAFGAFVATLGFDLVTRVHPRRARALLVLLSSALAVVRLAGLVPLSGHAAFAAAFLAYELLAPRPMRTPLGIPLASASLALTSWYKLWLWGDARWFLASIAAGAAVGGACGLFDGTRGRVAENGSGRRRRDAQ